MPCPRSRSVKMIWIRPVLGQPQPSSPTKTQVLFPCPDFLLTHIHALTQRNPGACELCGVNVNRSSDWAKHLATLKCRQAAFNQSQGGTVLHIYHQVFFMFNFFFFSAISIQCFGSAYIFMRIRIRDPENFHADPDPGRKLI